MEDYKLYSMTIQLFYHLHYPFHCNLDQLELDRSIHSAEYQIDHILFLATFFWCQLTEFNLLFECLYFYRIFLIFTCRAAQVFLYSNFISKKYCFIVKFLLILKKILIKYLEQELILEIFLQFFCPLILYMCYYSYHIFHIFQISHEFLIKIQNFSIPALFMGL